MKIYTYSIEKIGNDKLLRKNVKTTVLSQNIEVFNFNNTLRIKDLFDVISGFAFSSNDYVEDGVSLVRIGDLNGEILDFSSMIKLPLDFYEDFRFEKYQIKKDDILVSLTGDGKIKCAYVDKDVKCLLNQRVAILRKKNFETPTKFYYWILQTEYVKNQFSYYSNGKSQLNISPFDFANIKVPFVSDAMQHCVLDMITPIETEIENLTKLKVSDSKIINYIFKEKFNLNYSEFEELKKCKKYILNQSMFSDNIDLRFSTKFHRPAGKFVIEELENITKKKIKNFLAEPIVLGASISPAEYVDDGIYKYISMATIKNWYFNEDDANSVSDAYASSKQTKTVKKDDIIMARSGEGTIGKVALITDGDVDGIFADFTMRIRLKNYNPEFAYYYFRTEYFQYLIEIYKKGLGNNTNIFPVVIQEFPMIDIPLEEQQRVVSAIHIEISRQEEINKQIFELHSQIDQIIENAIKNDGMDKKIQPHL